MVKIKLYPQHYEWLSDDIRSDIYWILEWNESDDKLLDCAHDLDFIKTLCEDGVECKNNNECFKLGERIGTIVRKYDTTSNIRPRTVPGKNENEGIIFIYE